MAKPIKSLKDLPTLEDVEQQELETETPSSVAQAADTVELKRIEEILTDSEVSGGSIRLDRKGPTDLKWQFIGKMKVEDFSLEHIRSVFGGGDYKAQTIKSHGGYYKKFEFTIDYRFKGSMDSVPALDGVKPDRSESHMAAQMVNQQQTSSTLLMDIMTRSQNSNNQNMMLIMNMMQEGSKQNIAMMSGMFTALAAAMGKPVADPVQSYMPLMLEMVKNSGNKGEGTSITDVIAAVRELNALAKGETPPKEEKEEDMLDKVMKYGGPLITALLTRTPLQMPGAVVQAPTNGQVIDMPPQPVAVSKPAPKVLVTPPPSPNEMVQKINMYMEVLIAASEKNSDPGAYAQMISDMLTDEHFETLLGELNAPDWFVKVADGNSRVVAQQAWFTNLRTELFNLLQDDEQSTAITEQDGGGSPVEATGQGAATQAG